MEFKHYLGMGIVSKAVMLTALQKTIALCHEWEIPTIVAYDIHRDTLI